MTKTGWRRLTARVDPVAEWIVGRTSWIRDRLRITSAGMIALAFAAAALAAVSVVFAAVSEDVIARNGLEVQDAANLHFFASNRTGSLIGAAKLVTNFGGIGVLIPLALLGGAFLWFKGAPLILAVAPGISLAVAGFCAAVGKQLVGRTRPPAPIRLVAETEASFPSGHSTDSAALFIALALVVAVVLLRRPIARVVTVGLAASAVFGIGISRLVLGVHWPTDVIVGWSLGVMVAIVVTTAAVLISRQVPSEPSDQNRDLRWLWFRFLQLTALDRTTMHGGIRHAPA